MKKDWFPYVKPFRSSSADKPVVSKCVKAFDTITISHPFFKGKDLGTRLYIRAPLTLTRPQSSLILRMHVEDARGGRWEGRKIGDDVSSYSLYPPHRPFRRSAVIVSRDRSMTAYK